MTRLEDHTKALELESRAAASYPTDTAGWVLLEDGRRHYFTGETPEALCGADWWFEPLCHEQADVHELNCRDCASERNRILRSKQARREPTSTYEGTGHKAG